MKLVFPSCIFLFPSIGMIFLLRYFISLLSFSNLKRTMSDDINNDSKKLQTVLVHLKSEPYIVSRDSFKVHSHDSKVYYIAGLQNNLSECCLAKVMDSKRCTKSEVHCFV